MKPTRRTILVAAAALAAAIQIIRPARNSSASSAGAGDAGGITIPDDVRRVLQTACFDCHTNNTRYPWYAEVEPVGWWLAGHIADGKRNLNFDDLGAYPPRRRFIKLGPIEQQLNENEMPLPSYLLIHRDGVLSQEQKDLLIRWTRTWRDSLRKEYPPDSLERRPQR